MPAVFALLVAFGLAAGLAAGRAAVIDLGRDTCGQSVARR